MADQKVSDLPALNGADVDPADLLYIVDSSAGTAGSKKITIGQFQLSPWSAATVSGVAYFNGSKVPVSSPALTFDGATFDVTGAVQSNTPTATAAQLRVRQAGIGEYWLQVPASQNALAFVDNGTGLPVERARFNSLGNFGLGSVPLGTARLTVYGPQGDVQIRTDDGNVTAYVGYSLGTGASAVNYYGTSTNHDQAFITNNVEVVRMKKTGQMRFVPLAVAPTPAEAGDVYYDSGTNKLRCYNGSTWNDLF